jgi:hypothetical protein
MEVPQDVINKWQPIWQQICDMAYSRKNIVPTVSIEKFNYSDLLGYMLNSRNFDQITLDYTWKQTTSRKNTDGTPVEVFVVPELREIYVPRILFETLGVFQWFKHSFPNCSILFWEDEM